MIVSRFVFDYCSAAFCSRRLRRGPARARRRPRCAATSSRAGQSSRCEAKICSTSLRVHSGIRTLSCAGDTLQLVGQRRPVERVRFPALRHDAAGVAHQGRECPQVQQLRLVGIRQGRLGCAEGARDRGVVDLLRRRCGHALHLGQQAGTLAVAFGGRLRAPAGTAPTASPVPALRVTAPCSSSAATCRVRAGAASMPSDVEHLRAQVAYRAPPPPAVRGRSAGAARPSASARA